MNTKDTNRDIQRAINERICYELGHALTRYGDRSLCTRCGATT